MVVREREPEDDGWVHEALRAGWGRPYVVSRGRGHRPDLLPGLVALQKGSPVGLLTYRLECDELEVVTLQALRPRRGVGSALVRAAEAIARRRGCRRLWLVTTNDNAPAIAFYRALGMELAAVHPGAVAEARRLKPEIPRVGRAGEPMTDELEFEIRL